MKQRLAMISALSVVLAAATATTASAQWVACTGGSVTCTTQNTGVGLTNPQRSFVVSGSGLAVFQVSVLGGSATCCDGFQFQQLNTNSHLINEDNGFMAFWTNATRRMTIDNTGKVGIGTTTPASPLDVVGNINASGNISANGAITATYADVAEWVASDDALDSGTVVVVDSESDNHVDASTSKYATAVAGVVSANPGIILGKAAENKFTIATTGRVKVHATARNGAIHRGDLLVTSDAPGVAMRSEPITINGRTFHQPGTIIGKALEPLDSGTGDILVLLTLQ